MTDTISEPRSREQELQVYIADLHERIRHLESSLSALGAGLAGVAQFALDAAAGGDLHMPEGLHLLGKPQHHANPEDPDLPTWTITCSCGWSASRYGMSSGADAAGMMHIAEWLDDVTAGDR